MACFTKGKPCLFINIQVPEQLQYLTHQKDKRLYEGNTLYAAANLISHSAHSGVVGRSTSFESKENTVWVHALSLALSKLFNISKLYFPHLQEIIN